jgi:hypothetical protein
VCRFFICVSALAADAFHSTRAMRLNGRSYVCAQPKTRTRTSATTLEQVVAWAPSRACTLHANACAHGPDGKAFTYPSIHTGALLPLRGPGLRACAQEAEGLGLRVYEAGMSADGSAEERQAIRSTGTGSRRRTSFAAGMILEELCHVENHALDDEVTALLCPAQSVVAPRRTVTGRARPYLYVETGEILCRTPGRTISPKFCCRSGFLTCVSQSLPPSSLAPCSFLSALRSLPAHPPAGWSS